MGKYRSKDISETVTEITVKWAAEGRDSRVFVKETLLTEENIEPVLRMMRRRRKCRWGVVRGR
jgi:hypothetical protein